MATRIIVTILTVLSLAGCGQMGPLYLPTGEPAQTAPDTPEPKEPNA